MSALDATGASRFCTSESRVGLIPDWFVPLRSLEGITAQRSGPTGDSRSEKNLYVLRTCVKHVVFLEYISAQVLGGPRVPGKYAPFWLLGNPNFVPRVFARSDSTSPDQRQRSASRIRFDIAGSASSITFLGFRV